VLTVGERFPEFRANACVGGRDQSLTTIDRSTHADQWVVYFFYPKDFTFVCPTEIVEFNTKASEFAQRGAAIVGGSTDNEYCHLEWCRSHPGLKDLSFPLINASKLAPELGILDREENVCLRATFIVDPEGTIQFASAYNLEVGRNVDEVLRVLDALQSDALTPCNWQKGQETLSTAN